MSADRAMNRRDVVKLGVAAAPLIAVRRLGRLVIGMGAQRGALIERAIPSTGERVPVVGMGTAIKYENPSADQLVELRNVLRRFPELGGKVLDTAPSYGKA